TALPGTSGAPAARSSARTISSSLRPASVSDIGRDSPVSDGDLLALRRGRPGQTRHLPDLVFVQRLALEQRLRERVQRVAVLLEQALRLLVAFADDPSDLLVHGGGRRLTVGPRRVGVHRAEERVLPRGELHHAEAVAHAPAGDHVAHELGGLLDVVLRAGGARAEDDLFRRTAAQDADDPRAQVGLRVVVAVGVRALVRHAQRLAARYDGDAVHRVRAGDHQAEDGVAGFVVRDALPVLGAEQERPLGAQNDLLERVEEVFL